jgi:cytoskeletal protein CcmA (bactofilin family)
MTVEDPSDSRPAPARLLLVAEDGRFDGLVVCTGDFGIEGEVNGDVHAHGRLTVGAKAVIRGRVAADEVVVLGRVEGRVEASSRVELAATAHVLGDVASPKLRTSDGCRIEGRLAMRGECESAASSS